MMEDREIDLGAELLAGMREAVAFERGEIALPTRRIEPMPAARVKEIRKAVAKTTKEFERRFHISARTIEGWEQGKRVDAPAAAFLRVIEKNPQAVEEALAS